MRAGDSSWRSEEVVKKFDLCLTMPLILLLLSYYCKVQNMQCVRLSVCCRCSLAASPLSNILVYLRDRSAKKNYMSNTKIETAHQTFYLIHSQYTDTWLTSPSSDSITPGAWQGSHWMTSVYVTDRTRPKRHPYFFFSCVPQLYLWGSPFLGEIFAYVTVSFGFCCCCCCCCFCLFGFF